MVSQDNYNFFILLFEDTMTLTQTEIQLADENLEQAKEYEPVQLLSVTEQLALDVFNNINDYLRVGSTVEWPILDTTNVLYSIEGIDTDALFFTLNSRKIASGTMTNDKEEDVTFSDKKIEQTFTTYTQEIGNVKETWIQSEFGNNPRYVEDNTSDWQESLQDQNLDYNKNKIYRKQMEMEKRIMTNFKKLWKEYHHRKVEKDIAIWDRYVQCERNLKSIFVKIKRLEDIKKKYDEAMNRYYFKKNIEPRMDMLLKRFVDRQQKQLKMGKDPELSREDAIVQLKPEYKKYLHLYNI